MQDWHQVQEKMHKELHLKPMPHLAELLEDSPIDRYVASRPERMQEIKLAQILV